MMKKNDVLHAPIAIFWIKFVYICLILSDLCAVSFLSYFDEIAGAIMLLLTLIYILQGRLKENHCELLVFLLVCVFMSGLFGNIFSNIQNSLVVILIGAFIFFKQYVYSLFGFLCLSKYDLTSLRKFFVQTSKLFLFILFLSAIASRLFDIGMIGSGGEFCFFAKFGGTVANWTILFFAICYGLDKKPNRLIWFSIALIIVLLTQSGLGMLGIGTLPFIYFFYEKQNTFHIYYFIPIAVLGVFLSWDEITQYLLDPSAPRSELLFYSVVTAFTYFPIGAGFSTYASPMAASHYSLLYFQYGFDSQWGMSEDNALFLMDSYYPMVIGETGLVGTCLFIGLIILYYKRFILVIQDKRLRSSSIFLFSYLLVAGLGFGTGGAWGCAVYLLIAILYEMGLRTFSCTPYIA